MLTQAQVELLSLVTGQGASDARPPDAPGVPPGSALGGPFDPPGPFGQVLLAPPGPFGQVPGAPPGPGPATPFGPVPGAPPGPGSATPSVPGAATPQGASGLPDPVAIARQIIDSLSKAGQAIGVLPPDDPVAAIGDLVGQMVKSLQQQSEDVKHPGGRECQDALPSRIDHLDADGASAVIHFCQDSDALTGSARGTLDTLAALAVQDSGFSMQLLSHASKEGEDQYNQALSRQRGEAVKAYLAGHGLDGGLIEVLAMGSRDASGDAQRDRNVGVVLKFMAQAPEPGDDGKVRTAQFAIRADGSGGEVQVFFARGAAQLEASAIGALGICAMQCQQVLPQLQRGAVRVYGLSSLDGEFEANKQLSLQRALAVQTLLSVAGVPADIVKVTGDPPTDEFSKTDPSANRRAKVIWDLPQPGQGIPPGATVPPAGSGGTPPADGASPGGDGATPADSGDPQPGESAPPGNASPPPGETVPQDNGSPPPGESTPPGNASPPPGEPTPPGNASPPPGEPTPPGNASPPPGEPTPPAADDGAALPSHLFKETPELGTGVLFFAKDSAELTASARKVLDACLIHCKPGSSEVDLVGYASTEGQDGHNKSLAQARVDAVKSYLKGKGLEDGGIQAIGVGPTDKFSKSDLAPNRRVELSWVQMQVLSGEHDGGVAPAQVLRSKTGGSANLFFAKDSTELTASARKALDLIVADSQVPGAQLEDGCIEVIGLASTGGSDAHNKQVAGARADACKAWLVSHGIEPRYISAQGQGTTEDYSKTDPAANRRAMIAWRFGHHAAAPADAGGPGGAPAPAGTSGPATPGTPGEAGPAGSAAPGQAAPIAGKRPPAKVSLHFPTGSTALDGHAKAELDGLGDLRAATAIAIDAWCSLDGTPDENRRLSQRRAEAVASYLAGKGVPGKVLRAAGHGGTDQFSKQDPAPNRVTIVTVEF